MIKYALLVKLCFLVPMKSRDLYFSCSYSRTYRIICFCFGKLLLPCIMYFNAKLFKTDACYYKYCVIIVQLWLLISHNILTMFTIYIDILSLDLICNVLPVRYNE